MFRLDARLPYHLAEHHDGEVLTPGDVAQGQEAAGFAGTFSRESNNDPFLPLALAAESTSHIELGTAVAIAFARSPMLTAYSAHEVQAASNGRFVLGLGTQVRAHIERRYSMPWGKPVARMREYIGALRAIWDSWRTGAPLKLAGEYYQHTLMTPAFTPPPNDYSDPVVMLAAVGPAMVSLACQHADGIFTHPFASSEYLRSRLIPRINAQLAADHRSPGAFRIAASALVATGNSQSELRVSIEQLRAKIAFYGSTPAYRPLLELHGWGDLADRLHDLSRRGTPERWTQMARLIPDEAIRTIGITGSPDEVAREATIRYAGLVDRLALSFVGTTHGPAVDRVHRTIMKQQSSP